MKKSSPTIGYVLRHGATVAHQIDGAHATFLHSNPDENRLRIGTYRDGFEFDGPATVVMSAFADRCIQTALLVVAALVPGFDPFPRIALLEEYAKQAMLRNPRNMHDDWFRRAIVDGLCDGSDVLENFSEESPVERIELSQALVSVENLRRCAFPSDRVWVAVTHADVVARLRSRQVHDIHLWNMHPLTQFSLAVRP